MCKPYLERIEGAAADLALALDLAVIRVLLTFWDPDARRVAGRGFILPLRTPRMARNGLQVPSGGVDTPEYPGARREARRGGDTAGHDTGGRSQHGGIGGGYPEARQAQYSTP